jgi:thiol-disulfide isomerase/thioredoxin
VQSSWLEQQFHQGLPYQAYVATGTEEQQRRWRQVYELAQLSSVQANLIAGWTREMKILVVSGVWCGDCIEQCPLFERIAEANPERLLVRFVDRDVHRELSERLQINEGKRVPVVLFLAEDHAFCGLYGDRSLNRYRALAARQIGPSCVTGLLPPGEGELAATLQDWLDEFERIQLMLRLSPRLRSRHND